MEAVAIKEKQQAGRPLGVNEPRPAKRISWEDFEKKYLTREDSYKYEWVEGNVVKTKRTMDFKQIFIFTNLDEFFEQLKLQGKLSGKLISEVDTFFLENHRRPDIAWFSMEQIKQSKQGISPVPQFVIEIISTKDQMNLVEDKMEDYSAAGVKVVWQIFPKFEKVHVYAGSHLNEMVVRRGEETCSAAPVLPDFVISVKDIFKD
jgi:Uma2 family endonuclease